MRAQPAAHRLDRRAHPLERQRLPRREQVDARRCPRKVPRSGTSRSASPVVGTATTSGRRLVSSLIAAIASGAGRLGDGQGGLAASEHAQQRRIVAQQARQRAQRGARPCRSIGAHHGNLSGVH